MPDQAPLSVFLSYSRRDEELRERLETHLAQLRRDERIAIWHDRKIRAGEPWAERISSHLETAEALTYAHGQGVIHRDVKPASVLVDAAGHARLTDFDLVRAMDTSAGTRTGSMLGTFVYAAPELMIDAKQANASADVYGQGMTAVFAVYGQDLPPYVLRDGPGFVAGLEVSDAVCGVLARAVAWEPEERFDSVASFCEALRASLAPARVQPPPPPEPTPRPSSTGPEPTSEELFQWIETPSDGRVELWREIPAGSFRMGSPEDEGQPLSTHTTMVYRLQ